MKKLILFAGLITCLSSCGLFQKVHKEKAIVKVETKQEAKKDSTGITVDKTITTTSEKVDTAVSIPGKSVSQDTELNMDSLVNGMTAIKNDLVDVTLLLNPVTGILSATAILKPQLVPVKLSREIKKQNDIFQSGHKTEAIVNNSKSSDEKAKIDREPKKISWLVFLILGVVGIVVGALAWLINKKLKASKS